jgi:WD40 repeat protein
MPGLREANGCIEIPGLPAYDARRAIHAFAGDAMHLGGPALPLIGPFRRLRCGPAILVLFLLPPGEDSCLAEDVDVIRLVQQLGEDDFHRREEAAARLKALGSVALPALKRTATAGETVDMRLRAAQLVVQIESSRTAGDARTVDDVHRLWDQLASRDVRQTWSARCRLIEAGGSSIALLEEKLQAAAAPHCDVSELLAQLDDARFAIRNEALTTLRALDTLAAPQLVESQSRLRSPDSRLHVGELLNAARSPLVASADTLQLLRAIYVLEAIARGKHVDADTAERACGILRRLAGGAADSRVTQASAAALSRLSSQRGRGPFCEIGSPDAVDASDVKPAALKYPVDPAFTLKQPTAALAIAMSPLGPQVAVSGGSGGVGYVKVWDLNTQQEVLNLGHGFPMAGLAWSPCGKYLACGGGAMPSGKTGAASVWDAATGKHLRALEHVRAAIYSLDYSPDGRWIAGVGHDPAVNVWNAETGRLVLCVLRHTGVIYDVAFSPDGSLLATGGGEGSSSKKPGDISILELASGHELVRIDGHEAPVCSVAFSPDGRYLVTASNDQQVKIWDLHESCEAATLVGHIAAVHDAAFSPDGRYLASAGLCASIRLWDVSTCREVLTLRGSETTPVYRLTFDATGRRLLTASRSSKVNAWELSGLMPIE